MSFRRRLERVEAALPASQEMTDVERAARLLDLQARVQRRLGMTREAAESDRAAARFRAGADDPQTQKRAREAIEKVRRARQQYIAAGGSW